MKRFLMTGLLLVFIVLLTACGCQHEWSDANCNEPKRCRICGQRDGDPLAHNYREATCEEPKTCSLCGRTEGKAAGHIWQAATCHAPETCGVCGVTH